MRLGKWYRRKGESGKDLWRVRGKKEMRHKEIGKKGTQNSVMPKELYNDSNCYFMDLKKQV